MEDLIPVTIITGFLGAGKTTLLNRILTDEHGQKIAVIENEFGEESIDNDLLVQSEDEEIITMNNGCICCTIRGDLAENLIRLMERKKEGKANFDRVIIETTGLADPGPVAQTFFMDEEVAQFYMVEASSQSWMQSTVREHWMSRRLHRLRSDSPTESSSPRLTWFRLLSLKIYPIVFIT